LAVPGPSHSSDWRRLNPCEERSRVCAQRRAVRRALDRDPQGFMIRRRRDGPIAGPHATADRCGRSAWRGGAAGLTRVGAAVARQGQRTAADPTRGRQPASCPASCRAVDAPLASRRLPRAALLHVRRPATDRRASRALEDVKKVLTGIVLEWPELSVLQASHRNGCQSCLDRRYAVWRAVRSFDLGDPSIGRNLA